MGFRFAKRLPSNEVEPFVVLTPSIPEPPGGNVFSRCPLAQAGTSQYGGIHAKSARPVAKRLQRVGIGKCDLVFRFGLLFDQCPNPLASAVRFHSRELSGSESDWHGCGEFSGAGFGPGSWTFAATGWFGQAATSVGRSHFAAAVRLRNPSSARCRLEVCAVHVFPPSSV